MDYRTKRFFENTEKQIATDLLSSVKSNRLLGIDKDGLSAYLKLGYVPGNKTLFEGHECLLGKGDLQNEFSELPDYVHSEIELKRLFLSVIEKNFKENKDKIHVVPLSGGMDSRIVLAALLEFTEAKNIHTYTFGVPGSYDFDIPNKIAKKLGTKHKNFNSEDTNYSIDSLIRAAIASDLNTEIFHPVVLNHVADFYGPDALFWSGYVGDLVGGGFGSKLLSEQPKQAIINYEKRGIHFLDNSLCDDKIAFTLTEGDKFNEVMSLTESCFWENHVERYTGHHLFRNDMNIIAPFLDSKIMKFFYTLPENKRHNKVYFNEAFSSIFPSVFSFPTKDYGFKYSKNSHKDYLHKLTFYCKALGWRVFPKLVTHPSAAYIDMQYAINNREDVKLSIDILIHDLAKRDIVDNKKMFTFLEQHRIGKSNYTKDIINLASLEVILKAVEK